MAILEAGTMTPDTELFCPSSIEADGYVIRDAHERGDATYTLRQIMDQSSNVGISLATENATVGDVSGFRNLYNKINEYNLHTKTGVDYPGEGEAGTEYLGNLLPFDDWSKVTAYNVSFGQFFHDFQTNSTLTCHYIFIIEGMQECVALFPLQFYCLCSSIIIYTGNQNNFCAVALCSFNLSQRSACGHADSSLDAFFLCCQSNALCMVTCGTSDYTLGSFFFCQACCFYISTSQLEGACYLHIFAFDKYVCVRVDKSGFVQRCYSCNAFQCFFAS